MNANLPVCMIGGSGFVGAQVIRALVNRGREVRALQHERAISPRPAVLSIRGDVRKESDLRRFLAPKSIAINLAFLPRESAATNVQAALALAHACRAVGVRRLVHVSTAVVVGRSNEDMVTELTRCDPRSAYEASKLEIERALAQSADGLELAILRPTAVFGPGGRNLVSMLERLRRWPLPVRYALAGLYGRRRMNVVPVETVAAAALFLADTPLASQQEVFIVSEDEDPINNYRDIEDLLMQACGSRRYPLPVPRLDRPLLKPALWLASRSNTNPDRRYSSAKIRNAGFTAPVALGTAVRAFAKSCAS